MNGIVLAGGASSRMGRPKALLEIDGETFAGRLRNLLLEVCDRVVVVVGADAAAIAARIPDTIYAADWRRGMRASLRAGLRALPAGPVLLTHCDRPHVARATLGALARGSDEVLLPSYRGVTGHPVRIPARLRARLLFGDDVPLREVLRGGRVLPVDDPGILLNLNRPADLAALAWVSEGAGRAWAGAPAGPRRPPGR